jgi:hypothetical protein
MSNSTKLHEQKQKHVCYMKGKITGSPKFLKRDKILFRNWRPFFILIVCFLFLTQRVLERLTTVFCLRDGDNHKCVARRKLCVMERLQNFYKLENISLNQDNFSFCLRRQNYFCEVIYMLGARGGAFGWGTALQAGRSRVRFSIVLLEFFIDIILSVAGRFSL